MTQSKRLASVALALLAFTGCAAHSPVETFIYESWTLGFTSAELRERLGPPLDVKATSVENRHVPGQTDEIREVIYGGLVMTYYNVKEIPEREMLVSISMSSSKYDVRHGLKVGVPRDTVRRYLGDGFERLSQAEVRERLSDDVVVCDALDCAWVYTHPLDNSQVLFTFGDDCIKRIDWFFYSD